MPAGNIRITQSGIIAWVLDNPPSSSSLSSSSVSPVSSSSASPASSRSSSGSPTTYPVQTVARRCIRFTEPEPSTIEQLTPFSSSSFIPVPTSGYSSSASPVRTSGYSSSITVQSGYSSSASPVPTSGYSSSTAPTSGYSSSTSPTSGWSSHGSPVPTSSFSLYISSSSSSSSAYSSSSLSYSSSPYSSSSLSASPYSSSSLSASPFSSSSLSVSASPYSSSSLSASPFSSSSLSFSSSPYSSSSLSAVPYGVETALQLVIEVAFEKVNQYQAMIPNSGPDTLIIKYTDYQGQSGLFVRNVPLYGTDSGWAFLSVDGLTQFLIAGVNGAFFDANAQAINARNAAAYYTSLQPCANATRYGCPVLLPNQVRPMTFIRDGSLVNTNG